MRMILRVLLGLMANVVIATDVPAFTTSPVSVVLTVEQTGLTYDADPVHAVSENVLTGSELSGCSIPYLGLSFGLVAAKSEAELVNLASESRTTHILTGDATGGGHMFPGLPGKTAFPEGWSGPRIMQQVSDIATDPAAVRTVQSNGRTLVTGTRDGVQINVVLEPASKGGGIVTAFPSR